MYVHMCVCVGRGKELKSAEAKGRSGGRRPVREDADAQREARARRAAATGALSGAFKYSRVHRATGPACTHIHIHTHTCMNVCARARANSVLSKDWKAGEAPLHEILRAL